jgi:HTH-type transcriptional regulator/antitoxin HigA
MRANDPKDTLLQLLPIDSPQKVERGLALLDSVWGAADQGQLPQIADLLLDLIERYEADGVCALDPIEAIKLRLVELGWSWAELAPHLGGLARVSRVLNRQEYLGADAAGRLAALLSLPAALLAADYPLALSQRAA